MSDVTNLPPRPAPTIRSPIHLLTLMFGVAIGITGWAIATLVESGLIATTDDVVDLIELLPAWLASAPGTIASLGTVSAAIGFGVWLLWARRLRELALLLLGTFIAAMASSLVGDALLWVSRPEIRTLFEDLPREIARREPTDVSVAAVTAALALTRQWVPVHSRRVIFALYLVWLAASATTVDAPPYLGLILDIGLGLVAGSAVALIFGTPSLQPGRDELIAGLSRSGVEIATLEPAEVDARGSTPWVGTMADGHGVFVKAFSVEQRAADLLFRALRWLQLRRSGDRAPEMSLKRAAEHEALVSHHVQTFDLPSPRLLAVADLGDNNVALAYEKFRGHSLDQVEAEAITDDVLRQLWGHVERLRTHGIAHRDLRLANAFLRDDGNVALVDFGFAELAADSDQLDADVAELLAATACAVGVDRAVEAAVTVLGRGPLERARDSLQPLALSAATRAQVTADSTLEDLRASVEEVTGLPAAHHESIGRLSLQRIVGLVLIYAGGYSVISVLLGTDWETRIREIRWDLVGSAVALTSVSHLFVGASAHSLSGRRISNRATTTMALAATLPGPAPAPWAWAHDELADTARRTGLYPTRSRSLATTWVLIGMATSPLVAAVFAGAGWRAEYGITTSSLLAAAVGLGALAAQYAIFVATPWGRELHRVWMAAEPRVAGSGASIMTAAGWWIAARSVHGLGAALAMRSVGVEAPLELLVAVSVAATTLAALAPVPGGIGANEALLYMFLVAIGEPGLAGAAMVAARTIGFWLFLPAAWLAHRSLHLPSTARSHLTDRPPPTSP